MSRRKDADIAAEKAYLDALDQIYDAVTVLAERVPTVLRAGAELNLTRRQCLGQVSVILSQALAGHADAGNRFGHVILTHIRTSPLNPLKCRKAVQSGVNDFRL